MARKFWVDQNLRRRALIVCVYAQLFFPVWEGLAAEEKKPQLWGAGIQSCAHYINVRERYFLKNQTAVGEYRTYQDWLAGFVSGLSLATGMDVLRGVEIEGALRRISIHCEDNPRDDFFNATMKLVTTLGLSDQELRKQ